jgi:CHAT domain-containing protein
MSEQQAPAPQAEPTEPVKTVAETAREKRESTFKARQAKAAKRFAARNGEDTEPPKEEPKAEPAKAEQEKKPEAKAEEKPEKKPQDIDKRHAIAERREKRVQAREAAIKEREDKASRAEHNLQTRYGDPDAAKKAYDAGNHYEAAKYIQRIFGDDFASITQKIARATAGLSPEKLKELEERDQFAREKREFEARKKKEEEEKNAGTTREKAVAHVAEKCKGHDVLKLKNGADLVLRTLEKHWNKDHFTISFRQAADMVLADKLAEAEALGLKRHTATIVPSPAKAPEPEKPKREARHKPPAPVAKKEGRLSFEERHALAGRKLAQRRSL